MSKPLSEQLRELASKATPGPWEVDSEYDNDALYSGGGGCGRGFKNFFIGADVGGSWKTLMDTQNSDEKLIEEDYDYDSGSAWDEIGRANAELVAALRNALPTIITALQEMEKKSETLAAKQAREVMNPQTACCSSVTAGTVFNSHPKGTTDAD